MSDVEETDGEAATAALEDYRKSGGVSLAEIEVTLKPDTSPVCVEIDWERLGNVSCDWNFPFAIFDPSCRDALSADIMSVVNARSVADVRAEYLKELIAGAKAEYAAACKAMDGARMVSAYAHYSALRALTEGEG